MGNVKDNYGPSEVERKHRLSMELGSTRLAATLREKHPHIIAALERKHKEKADAEI